MTKTTKGYTVNHEAQTITLTKAFAKQSSIPSTKEFRELAALHKNFPEYSIEMRKANVKKDKEKHGGLTIPRMEYYIRNIAKDNEALAEFSAAKDYYKGTSGYYGKMKAWFLDKYPNYKEVDFAALVESQKEAVSSAENND